MVDGNIWLNLVVCSMLKTWATVQLSTFCFIRLCLLILLRVCFLTSGSEPVRISRQVWDWLRCTHVIENQPVTTKDALIQFWFGISSWYSLKNLDLKLVDTLFSILSSYCGIGIVKQILLSDQFTIGNGRYHNQGVGRFDLCIPTNHMISYVCPTCATLVRLP